MIIFTVSSIVVELIISEVFSAFPVSEDDDVTIQLSSLFAMDTNRAKDSQVVVEYQVYFTLLLLLGMFSAFSATTTESIFRIWHQRLILITITRQTR